MEDKNMLDLAFYLNQEMYDILDDDKKFEMVKAILPDCELLKNKILTAIKQKWIAQYGSLEDVEDLRNGFFVAGFCGVVLNELFPTEK